jgi:hypothetical protein
MKGAVAEHSRNVDLPRWLPRRDNVVALRAADWLSLGAAPTFAFMAAFTGILGGVAHEPLCSAGLHTSALSGMVPMYLLMSVFHLAPWWKLISRGEPAPRAPL